MLQELVESLSGIETRDASMDIGVSGVKSDSRQVERGDVFVAVRGAAVDGHDYVSQAAGRGAVACVTEMSVDTGDALNIVVPDSAKALAELAARYNGNPADSLRLVGVTGTNGKTSTTHLFRAICASSSFGNMGIIGTVGHGAGNNLTASVHTTPEPLTLHRILADMKSRNCVGVVMEVSSHAVRQQRVWGLDFEIGMLTNVTRDHLDYHPTFEDYVAAKTEFCESLVYPHRRHPAGTLVYSRDNDVARTIGEHFSGRKLSVSMSGAADVEARNIRATLDGTAFDLHIEDTPALAVTMKLLGSFSVANAALAAAGAHVLGIDADAIRRGLESVEQVPGRFEALGGGSCPVVVVDYSHTPDSLERVLEFCRGLGPRRLITVFGCGGDRDRGKRPLMGRIAETLSDVYYVTSDNPRTEDPESIIEDILQGVDRNGAGIRVEPDRRKAIRSAVTEARQGDLVAICGKGHEDYQIVGTKKHHFDDREEAAAALDAWSAT